MTWLWKTDKDKQVPTLINTPLSNKSVQRNKWLWEERTAALALPWGEPHRAYWWCQRCWSWWSWQGCTCSGAARRGWPGGRSGGGNTHMKDNMQDTTCSEWSCLLHQRRYLETSFCFYWVEIVQALSFLSLGHTHMISTSSYSSTEAMQ